MTFLLVIAKSATRLNDKTKCILFHIEYKYVLYWSLTPDKYLWGKNNKLSAKNVQEFSAFICMAWFSLATVQHVCIGQYSVWDDIALTCIWNLHIILDSIKFLLQLVCVGHKLLAGTSETSLETHCTYSTSSPRYREYIHQFFLTEVRYRWTFPFEMWQDAEPSLQKEPWASWGAADPGCSGSGGCLHCQKNAGTRILS